jgi:hypothetical protein
MTQETKKPANKIKLNRTQIREGLKQLPIETIIMGEGKKRTLTTKQKGFIRDVALGETKAQAYRNNYNTKTKAKYQGDAGYKMSTNPVINQEIEAFKMALEAQAHYEGGNLKALIMHQLTLHALNEDNPPASRIRSLELLGKSYDVGLFVERKEITTINNSMDAKNKLMKQLREALNRNALTVDYDMTGESLLEEIKGVSPLSEISEPQTHRTPTTQNGHDSTESDLHTIPHNGSQAIDLKQENPQVATFTDDINDMNNDAQVIDSKGKKINKGEGVSNFTEEVKGEVTETPPVTVWTEKG